MCTIKIGETLRIVKLITQTLSDCGLDETAKLFHSKYNEYICGMESSINCFRSPEWLEEMELRKVMKLCNEYLVDLPYENANKKVQECILSYGK